MTQAPVIEFADLAESREFREFFEIVRDLTGVQAVLTDQTMSRTKQLFPRSAMNPLCLAIQSDPAGHAACAATDRLHGARAAKLEKGVHYLCHAGLIDFCLPVFVDGKHIATVGCGQVLPEAPSEVGFRRFLARNRHLKAERGRLRRAYFASPWMSEEKRQAVFRLLSFFTDYFCEAGARLKGMTRPAERPDIDVAIKFIQHHFREPIGLADASRRAGMSPAYFSSIFRKTTGVPFARYLQQVRVNEVRRLLTSTDMSVTEIAFGSGFNSLTHFNRVFQKHAKCAPSAYRRRIRNHGIVK
jgi:AraC-like DNA-binding protein/ligand-binding sensor protein